MNGNKWVFWLIGVLLSIQFALIGVIYYAMDVRMTAVEARGVLLQTADQTMAIQLARIDANQQAVMKGLDVNGGKLDDLLKQVYTLLPYIGGAPQRVQGR